MVGGSDCSTHIAISRIENVHMDHDGKMRPENPRTYSKRFYWNSPTAVDETKLKI